MNRLRKWKWHAGAPVSGAFMALAFAPHDFSYFAPLSLTFFYACCTLQAAGRAVLLGYLFGLGLFGCGNWWVYISIHDFGGADAVSSSLLTAILVAFLAIFPALTAGVVAKGANRAGPWQRITFAGLVWVAIEYFRGDWLLNGYPWLQIAYTQLNTPLAGYAPVLGVYGMGFLLAVSASALVETGRQRLPTWRGLLPIVLVWGGGWLLKGEQWTHAIGEPIKITLIQGNIAQDQKWLPDQRTSTLRLYQDLTERHWDSDVVIWPETAIPAFFSDVKEVYLDPLAAMAREHGTDIVVSLPSGGDKVYYNSVLVLSDMATWYHKNHLLPFGEYLPWQPLSGWVLDRLQIPLGSFTAGADRQTLLQAGGYAFITTICYEDAFGEQMLKQLDQAAYLVNLTNDAWFGNTAEPHQHMQMAQMRALETGRYLVRATNTGVSGFVGPDGMPRQRAPMFVTTTLTASIVPMAGLTPYARLGDVGVFALLSLLTALPWAARWSQAKLR